jgi:GNAT superfamily N-acetyltransferase
MPPFADRRLISLARPWIERELGFALPAETTTPSTIVRGLEPDPARNTSPLLAFRIDSLVAATVRPSWLRGVEEVMDRLHPDQVFSVLGTYELGRVTLPDGVAVWGPVPNYIADRSTWRPVEDGRAVLLGPEQMSMVDWKVFWHCERNSPIASFGVYEEEKLVALATVGDRGDSIWEIGVDVAPGLHGRGLGSAVVSAAGNWILDHGAIVHATVAFWNVPSSRNMRALGMQYVFSVMRGREGPFFVPPQPLGTPLPGVEIYDNYPRWAMNPDIRPRPEQPAS